MTISYSSNSVLVCTMVLNAIHNFFFNLNIDHTTHIEKKKDDYGRKTKESNISERDLVLSIKIKRTQEGTQPIHVLDPAEERKSIDYLIYHTSFSCLKKNE